MELATPNEESVSFSYILNVVKDMPADKVDEYLFRVFADRPDFIEKIKDILKVDQNNPSLLASKLTEIEASKVVVSFEPESFVGQRFGDWILTEVISQTKKSAVFKATPSDGSFDFTVAIKIVSPSYAFLLPDDHSSKQAHFMAQLSHRNLVEIKGGGTTEDGVRYLVMEYLSGQNVVDHVIKNKLSLKERLKIFIQLCDGVESMHIKGVVHSDLKPDNVLMDHHQSVKIIDFDLSSTSDKNFHLGFNYHETKGHTKAYASPELLEFGLPTPISDIYSLGVILKEMLGGNKQGTSRNFIDENYGKSYRNVELYQIIKKATSESPDNRYNTVSSLKADLASYLGFC